MIYPELGRVFLAGHRGMAGSAIARRLAREDCEVVTTGERRVDFRDQAATHAKLAEISPDTVIIAAAKVGGIEANNTQPGPFLYDNLMIVSNLVEAARLAGVRKLLFLGSSCIYPRMAAQPIAEDSLLTGPLEPTNQWYAIAKIAGIKLCDAYRRSYGCDFISVMPTNLFGPGDNYDPKSSHVPAALLRRFHEAREASDPEVIVWGTGTPRREFMHVDDLADGCIFALRHFSGEGPVNIGWGQDISIGEFAELIGDVTGYAGRLTFDTSKPDGTPRKLLDTSRMAALGWSARIPLRDGLADAYADFTANVARRAAA